MAKTTLANERVSLSTGGGLQWGYGPSARDLVAQLRRDGGARPTRCCASGRRRVHRRRDPPLPPHADDLGRGEQEARARRVAAQGARRPARQARVHARQGSHGRGRHARRRTARSAPSGTMGAASCSAPRSPSAAARARCCTTSSPSACSASPTTSTSSRARRSPRVTASPRADFAGTAGVPSPDWVCLVPPPGCALSLRLGCVCIRRGGPPGAPARRGYVVRARVGSRPSFVGRGRLHARPLRGRVQERGDDDDSTSQPSASPGARRAARSAATSPRRRWTERVGSPSSTRSASRRPTSPRRRRRRPTRASP